jgi:peptidoglycan/xylan/chitin deacetylase (PgdA/CDA1 family)
MFRGTRYWIDQITRADDAIAQVTGVPPRFFRPPMGFKSPLVARAVRRLGHTVVAWSRRAFDGVGGTPDRVVRALGGAQPGDILLLHDGRDPHSRRATLATARALPRVLECLRGRGLEPVRLDQLIEPR